MGISPCFEVDSSSLLLLGGFKPRPIPRLRLEVIEVLAAGFRERRGPVPAIPVISEDEDEDGGVGTIRFECAWGFRSINPNEADAGSVNKADPNVFIHPWNPPPPPAEVVGCGAVAEAVLFPPAAMATPRLTLRCKRGWEEPESSSICPWEPEGVKSSRN